MRKSALLLFSLFLTSALSADESAISFSNDVSTYTNEQIAKSSYENSKTSSQVIIRGILVVNSEDEILTKEEVGNLEGVCFLQVNLPGPKVKLEKNLRKKFIGQPLNKEKIELIKETIFRFYRDAGYPFVEILVPPQEITSGILQVIVIPCRLATVGVRGNEHTRTQFLQKSISTQKGEIININKMARDVNFINRNPFRHVDAIYAPGEEPNTTDLILSVDDTLPFRIYGGVDNSGLQTVGRNRWLSGFIWGRAFGLNAVLTYQYSAAFHLRNFQAHTGQYIWLLPWKHIFNLYGGYAMVRPKNRDQFANSKGKSIQGSFRYTVPFIPSGMLNQELTLGGDYKRTNNTVEFSELFLNFSNSVNLTQIMANYTLDYEGKSFRIHFEAEGFYSPAQWLPDQSNADYNNLRPGAKNKYFYGRGALVYLQRLPASFSFTLRGRGQWASDTLLPSEQYGIGGWDTVRGYEERQLNMDSAFILNYEIRTPPIACLSRKYWKRTKDALQFLLFMDYGYGRNRTPIPTEPKSGFLLGAGPGIRYTIDPWVSLRYDLGFKWHSSEIFTGGGSMNYFSAIISF